MKTLLISFALLAMLPTQDQRPNGTISGVITSESSGAAIANATIALSHSSFVTHTDKNGAYRLSNIPSGVYDLTISAPGYVKMVYSELMVPSSIRHVFSIKLRDDGGKPGQSIAIKLSPLPELPAITEDRMLFYQPDSTVDFKLRIVNPESKSRDSSATKRGNPNSVRH